MIFIVEDEMILSEHLKRFLEGNGYGVEIYPHGESCLKSIDAGAIPDLILMDIDLGRNRMDGPSVTREIHKRNDVPVILHSAYTDKDTIDSTLDMTKYGYIQKVPGNEEFILASIDMSLKLFEKTKALEKSEAKYRELLEHSQNIREEQNAFIAKEVHDELGQNLTLLNRKLSEVEEAVEGEKESTLGHIIIEKVSSIKSTVDETIKKTKELAWQLKPSILESSSLMELLTWQVCEYRRKLSLPIHFEAPEKDCRLDKRRGLAVYRIVQEALTNCARYAEATEIGIEAEVVSGSIEILIRDNGSGFDPADKGLRDSFGLVGMAERAKQFGGDVRVSSEPGAGTEVRVDIPTENSENA